ncbi:hypothetical protein HUK65_06025 [Rhodobacteraceae bacterium 2376]|uniref:Uncharacterized protein n=1 Tax=Rhabdonatronobacter sediminivivens TaxID=2743469 RepID=A0A7Z0KXM6_9RHOB|nr:hypothetical protein [Rhabdonatronobacter sediminivivens]NYS24545.1 hypothetical protein [Rhabdonatronobacter sediminivivens]
MAYQLHPSAPAFAVQPDMTGFQDRAVATPLADGGMLVVYQNRIQPDPEDDWDHSVRAQRLDSAGNRIGDPQTLTEFSHWYSGIWAPPGAVGLADGGYAIAWSDFETQHLLSRLMTPTARRPAMRSASCHRARSSTPTPGCRSMSPSMRPRTSRPR